MSTTPQPNPAIDPNPAPWLASLLVNMQAMEDARFAKAEAQYRSDAANWVTNCIQNYQSGAPIQPFTETLPSKEVFQAIVTSSPTFGAQPFTSHVVFDPTLQPPVAPPNTIVVAPYHNPFGTPNTTSDPTLSDIWHLLNQILSKLGA